MPFGYADARGERMCATLLTTRVNRLDCGGIGGTVFSTARTVCELPMAYEIGTNSAISAQFQGPLPAIRTLRAFESAGRLGSFSRAADELRTT